jgi:cell division protein FtsB
MITRETDNSTQSDQPPRLRQRPRLGAEARDHRRRVVSYVLIAGAAVLMVSALVGENGYLAGLRARRDYNAVMGNLIRLRVENQQLREQARRLKDDPSAIEDSARRELGLIRPGETLVIVRDGAKKDVR